MALFRAEVKPISRGKGHNAVAAAAYRAGEKLTDTNSYNPNAKTHDYSRKKDILHKAILLPQALLDAGFSVSRQDLWSQVEAHEITKKDQRLKDNARVAREWLLALPHELSRVENIELAESFAQRLVDELGVIADCCIHDPSLKNRAPAPKPSTNTADKESESEDERNIHAHIMFTTRKATLNAHHELVFTDKADCELDGTARKKKGLVKEADYLKEIRSLWAEMINERLVAHGLDTVSALSYQDQNLDLLPQIHIGRDPLTDSKRSHNDDIVKRNKLVYESKTDTVQRLANRADESIGVTDKLVIKNNKLAGKTDQRLEQSERLIEYLSRPAAPNPFNNTLKTSINRRERAAERLIGQEGGLNRATADRVAAISRIPNHISKLIKQREVSVTLDTLQVPYTAGTLFTILLSRRTNDRYILRLWQNPDDPEHAHKFDRRQLEMLDRFTYEQQLNQGKNEQPCEFQSRLLEKMRDSDFFIKHATVFKLIGNPGTERKQYHAKISLENDSKVLDSVSYPSIKKELDSPNKAIQEPSVPRNTRRF